MTAFARPTHKQATPYKHRLVHFQTAVRAPLRIGSARRLCERLGKRELDNASRLAHLGMVKVRGHLVLRSACVCKSMLADYEEFENHHCPAEGIKSQMSRNSTDSFSTRGAMVG